MKKNDDEGEEDEEEAGNGCCLRIECDAAGEDEDGAMCSDAVMCWSCGVIDVMSWCWLLRAQQGRVRHEPFRRLPSAVIPLTDVEMSPRSILTAAGALLYVAPVLIRLSPSS
jgi:hypothetical protein